MDNKSTYDAIIIGAGISGLVCGSYLVKSGMKVLIVEQHSKPGGYCSSFRRKGFKFDAAAHSFGSYRNGGFVKKTLSDLGIDKTIEVKRYDPIDIVVTPDFKILFYNNINDTLSNLRKVFPDEINNINNFFNYLISIKKSELIKLRNSTFQDILSSFFHDNKLIQSISLPIFGYVGLPPSLMHAFTAISVFTEWVFDGGYYIAGGMQTLPDAFDKYIKQNKGIILYNSLVKKIICNNNKVVGIQLDNNKIFKSKYIISACDISQTFINLLGERLAGKNIVRKLNSMQPSLSAFIIYLGIDKYFKELPPLGSNIWFLPYYNLDQFYNNIVDCSFDKAGIFKIRVSPEGKTITAFINVAYNSTTFWEQNKKRMTIEFINRIAKLIPNLKKHIVYFDSATPQTLQKYTFNRNGAAFGW
ncbi:MAG TPA: NAD(P)/FAD-dependent oxidoreductase, partial [Candidatus Pacearchaeota archaeon]|nr:NAD(P)/FAD-dependent oxidoreductase [Candidatus Pacearchaeota archaeon]